MFVNENLKEIHLKIVFFGPVYSGKSANIHYIHAHTIPAQKGSLFILDNRENPSAIFDYFQLETGRFQDKSINCNIYTVPDPDRYSEISMKILRGADGLVYVADSRESQLDINLQTLLALENHLKKEKRTLERFPWVLQYNKRDLPAIATIEEMDNLLNFYSVPRFETIAPEGKGVADCLKGIVKRSLASVRERIEYKSAKSA